RLRQFPRPHQSAGQRPLGAGQHPLAGPHRGVRRLRRMCASVLNSNREPERVLTRKRRMGARSPPEMAMKGRLSVSKRYGHFLAKNARKPSYLSVNWELAELATICKLPE